MRKRALKARRTRRPIRQISATQLIKETAGVLYAIFQQQRVETQTFLVTSGIHAWLYTDAQAQIAEEENKSQDKTRQEIEVEKITVPYKELDRRLKGWWVKTQKSRDKMVKRLQRQNKKAGDIGGQEVINAIGVDVSFYLQDKRMLAELFKRGTKITGVVSQNTLAQFRDRLVKHYYYQGEDPRQVKKAIDGLFKETYKNRSWTIARTEVSTARGAINYQAMVKNKIKRKRWLATQDGLTRISHIRCAAEGAIDADTAFSNGLMYPGEPDGPPEEVINCRCKLESVIMPEDEKPTATTVWAGQQTRKR